MHGQSYADGRVWAFTLPVDNTFLSWRLIEKDMLNEEKIDM